MCLDTRQNLLEEEASGGPGSSHMLRKSKLLYRNLVFNQKNWKIFSVKNWVGEGGKGEPQCNENKIIEQNVRRLGFVLL